MTERNPRQGSYGLNPAFWLRNRQQRTTSRRIPYPLFTSTTVVSTVKFLLFSQAGRGL